MGLEPSNRVGYFIMSSMIIWNVQELMDGIKTHTWVLKWVNIITEGPPWIDWRVFVCVALCVCVDVTLSWGTRRCRRSLSPSQRSPTCPDTRQAAPPESRSPKGWTRFTLPSNEASSESNIPSNHPVHLINLDHFIVGTYYFRAGVFNLPFIVVVIFLSC